ncbi:dienelactone hydrolase family protein [Pacificimonas sp. ICDLI1SI03]
MSKNIEISLSDGTLPAYLAEPAGRAEAAIVVIQEVFGVNAGIRRKCDVLAESGYLAIAPDLFWREEPGIELDPDVKPEMDRALSLFGEFDIDKGVRDIQAAISEARKLLRDDGKVGAVGYCAGGRLAFLTATRTNIDASVSYYGAGIEQYLNEKDAIARPLMLHFAGEDTFVPGEAVAEVRAALDAHSDVDIYEYEGVGHGFAAEFGNRRDEAAASLADERTAAFFARHLQ